MTLCALLGSPTHRQLAVDCLLAIMERKDSKEDRKPLLSTFNNIGALTSSGEMLPVHDCSPTVPQYTAAEDDFDPDNYAFMKRICQVGICHCAYHLTVQVLVVIGTHQLCTLWSPQGVTKKAPENMEVYLAAVMEVTRHPRSTNYAV